MAQDNNEVGEVVYLGSFSDADTSSTKRKWCRIRSLAGYGLLIAVLAGVSFLVSYPLFIDFMGK